MANIGAELLLKPELVERQKRTGRKSSMRRISQSFQRKERRSVRGGISYGKRFSRGDRALVQTENRLIRP
ncbi:MAG: hypothetical protein ACLU8D_05785 [Enterocloster sp.]